MSPLTEALLLSLFISRLTLCGLTHGHETGPPVHKVVVKEGSDAVLPCSFNTNTELKVFDWKDGQKEVFLYADGSHYNNGRAGQDEQFKGRVTHFPDELKNGNASITIRNTKVSDSGNYTCVFPRLQPEKICHTELVVAAVSKLFIKIAAVTESGALLQCDVQGAFPKPKVELKDSAGNILPAKEPQVTERGGSYNVTLQTTVTKTDNYSCVATQEGVVHMFDTEILVSEKLFEDRCSTVNNLLWLLVGAALGVAVHVLVLPLVKKCIKKCYNEGSHCQTNSSCDEPSKQPLNESKTEIVIERE